MKVATASSDYSDLQNTVYAFIINTLCNSLNIHLLAVVNISRPYYSL